MRLERLQREVRFSKMFFILLLKFEFYPDSKGKTFLQQTDMMRGSTGRNVL